MLLELFQCRAVDGLEEISELEKQGRGYGNEVPQKKRNITSGWVRKGRIGGRWLPEAKGPGEAHFRAIF